jgi:hypothetical protein
MDGSVADDEDIKTVATTDTEGNASAGYEPLTKRMKFDGCYVTHRVEAQCFDLRFCYTTYLSRLATSSNYMHATNSRIDSPDFVVYAVLLFMTRAPELPI